MVKSAPFRHGGLSEKDAAETAMEATSDGREDQVDHIFWKSWLGEEQNWTLVWWSIEPWTIRQRNKKGREATHVSNYFQTSGILVQHFTLSLKHHSGLTRWMIPVIRAGSHTQQYVGYANNDWDFFEMGSTGQPFETLISNMINMRMGTWKIPGCCREHDHSSLCSRWKLLEDTPDPRHRISRRLAFQIFFFLARRVFWGPTGVLLHSWVYRVITTFISTTFIILSGNPMYMYIYIYIYTWMYMNLEYPCFTT